MRFDVVVIGGGHAGIEAAHASARLGCKTALITLDETRIGFMSCNPAIGGLAKGQLVKEIDALGGVMGVNTDKTAIQYRRLNASKGPAVRSSRAQCDKNLYAKETQKFLATLQNLSVFQGEIAKIETENGKVRALETTDGRRIECRAAVLTAGTFLRAVMFTGFEKSTGGRAGDPAASLLSENLIELGFKLGRLKTGTPPRLKRSSIDFTQLIAQPGDEQPVPFSFYFKPERFPLLPQIHCYITHTNDKTHKIIEANFQNSPMYTGLIEGVGPRYCPSIEDKVKRFRHRDRHQIFLEPEGLDIEDVYVNGVSTSLPREAQLEFIHTIKGLERAEFIRYGYAVEYDCIDSRCLRLTMEAREITGLYFAGQVNGTSGYEEAAAQGLIAGINAALQVLGRDPFVLERSQAYIGVLINDLVMKGADEPYRMFTSRAEHRLLLREDNADLRLSEKGYGLGLLSEQAHQMLLAKLESIEAARKELSNFFLYPTEETNRRLVDEVGSGVLKDRTGADALLRRPEFNWQTLCSFGMPGSNISPDAAEQVEIQIKYEGYIRRELELLAGISKYEQMKIPLDLDLDRVPGLSNEVKSRFRSNRPETIGQVSQMRGVTPAAVANLLIFLKMNDSKYKGLEVKRE